MAELKTKLNAASVSGFLDSVEDEQKRSDSYTIVKMMERITNCEPKMWGTSIVGFGSYHYKYASGREGDWMKTGFSPRKQNLTLYLMCHTQHFSELLSQLGKYKTGKGCLYIKKLADIDHVVLEKLVSESFTYMSEKYD